jgi:predicted small metal-binding protein
MAKELRCGDVVAGCNHLIRGETEDEVMKKGAQHASEAHGMRNMDEETRRMVRSKIRTV